MNAFNIPDHRVLLVGGSGRLGGLVLRRLRSHGIPVRVLTRTPEKLRGQVDHGVEVAQGDLREPTSVRRALPGIRTVISAAHGLAGSEGANPRTVDWLGNRDLIEAAQSEGVDKFVFLSIAGASPNHPLELFRMKYRAEQSLAESRLAWTVIRPTAFMETWIEIMAESLAHRGKIPIFGRGESPVNFVSAHDVARFVESAALGSEMQGRSIEVGGPKNLTLLEFADIVESVIGSRGARSHVPRAALRLVSIVARLAVPRVARFARLALYMDTHPMLHDPADVQVLGQTSSLTTVAEATMREHSLSPTDSR